MNIAIVVYSQTGHTREVVESLAEKLHNENRAVSVHPLETAASDKDHPEVQLTSWPDVADADILILAAPVHAFSLAPAMDKYLQSLGDLKEIKALLIMTQHFPYPWMGGLRAMGQFKNVCSHKGAEIIADGIINWSNKKRPEQIRALIEKFSQVLEPLHNA